MRVIRALMFGGALALAAGAVPASADSLATTVPQSVYSTLQVQTPNGIQTYNSDGYGSDVTPYGHFGDHHEHTGRAATAVAPRER